MKVEWLYEAQCELRDFLTYYKTNVGPMDSTHKEHFRNMVGNRMMQ